ncbi:hypothetical protein DsansV1_C07g0071241 [Dioscorea sansibarensis]
MAPKRQRNTGATSAHRQQDDQVSTGRGKDGSYRVTIGTLNRS